MWNKIRSFARNDAGASSIEYALIAGGIFIAIVTTVYALGPDVEQPFSNASSALQ